MSCVCRFWGLLAILLTQRFCKAWWRIEDSLNEFKIAMTMRAVQITIARPGRRFDIPSELPVSAESDLEMIATALVDELRIEMGD